MDILGAASIADDIIWWENTNSENTNSAGTSWTEHTIDGSFDGAASIYAVDIDGDGDMDILGATAVADEMTWWENTNSAGTSWTEHTIDGSFDGAASIYAVDIDGDGDAEIIGAASVADTLSYWDIVRTKFLTMNIPANATEGDDVLSNQGAVHISEALSEDINVLLYSNDTTEVVVPEMVVIFAGQTSTGFDLTILDDDVLDGVKGVGIRAEMATYIRLGIIQTINIADNETATLSLDIPCIVDDDAGTLYGNGTVMVSDVVGDDCAVTLNSNNPNSVIVPASVIIPEGENVASFNLTILDIEEAYATTTITALIQGWVSGSDTIIVLGSDITEHTLDNSFDGVESIYAADIDGDGDMDILGAAYDADDITWWENTNGTGTTWVEHTVDSSFDGASAVYAADIDGDGDMDILGAAYKADDITWWENTNSIGISWTEHTIDGAFDGAKSVYSADVDGDGDMDVLGATSHASSIYPSSSDEITWWENNLGRGTSWTKHIVGSSFNGAKFVYSADIDGKIQTAPAPVGQSTPLTALLMGPLRYMQ